MTSDFEIEKAAKMDLVRRQMDQTRREDPEAWADYLAEGALWEKGMNAPLPDETETQQILNDPETMQALAEAEEDIAAGNTVTLEEVQAAFEARRS